MAVQVARSMNNVRRKIRQHQHAPVRPQDPTLKEQAMGVGRRVAMEKAQDVASPHIDSIWTSFKDKVNPYITKGVDGVKAAFTSPPPVSSMSEVATPLMKSGVDGPLANAVAKETIAKQAAGQAAGSGAMASLGAAAPWLLGGYFGGKALGLFNKGGFVKGPLHAAGGSRVFRTGSHSSGSGSSSPSYAKEDLVVPEEFRKNNILENLRKSMEAFEKNQDASYRQFGGPISKVKYKQAGGPVNEEIEVSYAGPLSKGA